MIGIDTNTYEERKVKFLEYKETLEKEPTDPEVKKQYVVGCKSFIAWNQVHQILMQDGTLDDNIPPHGVECTDEYKHSPLRGKYLLNDSEAEQLRNHPLVEYVNIDASKYPGTYLDNPDDISFATKFYRYSSNVYSQRQPSTSVWPSSNPGSNLKDRASYNIKRHMQQNDPWLSAARTSIFQERLQQYGDGSDVDVIVCDEDMWFGHIEFQNNLGGPSNYRGGNVLPGNGTCDLLDLVLDAPYYLDPDFFNLDPANRLETRWDGTIVPTNTAAHEWWENNSTSYRSTKFVSPSNGGTATGANDFGVLAIPSGYTRANSNGSNTSYQTGSGFHGTPCASQAYGRQYGWAYNANKWFLNLYGTNPVYWEVGFDLQKIFHKIKPINPSYGTKDPTISSNSWGLRLNMPSAGYYYHRQGTSGTGTLYSSKPAFFAYHFDTMREFATGHSILTAGEELIDSGVIFLYASGNNNQKVVQSTHSDFNNYIAWDSNITFSNAYSTSPYSSFSHPWYYSTNRIGFPGQIGVDRTTTPHTYKTIGVGALQDTEYNGGTLHPDNGKEQKAYYSNVGNGVDVFAAAHNTGASCDDNTTGLYGTRYPRYDEYYTINGQQSALSEDRWFSGTSSACPIFAGLLATKVQFNRSWTYSDVRTWIQGLGSISPSNFAYRSEGTSANDSNYATYYSMHGNAGYVAYDKTTGNEPSYLFETSISNASIVEGDSLTITVTTNAPDGTYYYSIEACPGNTIVASDFTQNSLTGSYTVSSGSGTITLTTFDDSTSSPDETFRLRLRTGSVSGSIVATTQRITNSDAGISQNLGGGGLEAPNFISGEGITIQNVSLKYT